MVDIDEKAAASDPMGKLCPIKANVPVETEVSLEPFAVRK